MADHYSAQKKIEAVMMDWFTQDPIMLNIMCMVNKKADPSQETIGVDLMRNKVPTIVYNPNFVNSISKERLELVMASEGFKILLRHATTRLKEPRQIASLSSSITINQLMNSELRNILAGLDEVVPTPDQYNLPADQYFEEYFRKLMDRQDQVNQQIAKIWGSMSDEEKEEAIKNAMQQMQGQGQPQEGEGQGQGGEGEDGDDQQQGQGQGQGGGQEGKDGEGFKEFNNPDQAMKDYYDPNGTANQGWGSNDLFDSDVKNFIESRKDSARDWGKHTGNAMAEIIAALEPKISAKEVVRRFGRSVLTASTIASRMKINRRHDLGLPGYRRQYKSKIIFALDVSGSMTDEDLKEGFAVVNSCLKFADIICVQFDTAIKNVERKFKKAKQTFKVHGRGGTDFNEVLNFADEEKVDGIVIYTDGYASPPPKPKCKVLWLMHTTKSKPPVDWGYCAFLERYEDTHSW